MFVKPDDYIAPQSLDILFDEAIIIARLDALAIAIHSSLGAEFLMIGLLKGSFVFMADLVRALHRAGCTPQVDFLTLSSYGAGKASSGELVMKSEVADSVEHKPVLLVDDILESGRTLSFAKTMMIDKGAASVNICVLLDKPDKRIVPIQADYTGFVIEDKFVVGYGLDYAGYYRELPFIGVL